MTAASAEKSGKRCVKEIKECSATAEKQHRLEYEKHYIKGNRSLKFHMPLFLKVLHYTHKLQRQT